MTDPLFIPSASKPDTIHQCAECQFLFRGSSLDAHQRLAATLTGRFLCRVDGVLWWVEERAARARIESVRQVATNALFPSPRPGCQHRWVSVWTESQAFLRCMDCGGIQEHTVPPGGSA